MGVRRQRILIEKLILDSAWTKAFNESAKRTEESCYPRAYVRGYNLSLLRSSSNLISCHSLGTVDEKLTRTNYDRELFANRLSYV